MSISYIFVKFVVLGPEIFRTSGSNMDRIWDQNHPVRSPNRAIIFGAKTVMIFNKNIDTFGLTIPIIFGPVSDANLRDF